MKNICKHCNNIATWCYLPGDSYCCDIHVPRGCYCNIKYSSSLNEEGSLIPILDENGNFIEEKDPITGLLLPCCEWIYCEYGFEI